MTTASSRTASLPRQIVLLGRDIKLSHSVFALPFALLATFLAAGSAGASPGVATLGLIVVCMVLARTVAMAVNRWADRELDAANPRTTERAIPRGALSPGFVLAATFACAAGFIAAASGFWWLNGNPWPVVLSPLVLAYLAGYSFTKRFTWLCHLVLGTALALSPLAATIAVEPGYLATVQPYLLAVVVACWVAGFDVIYALQDVQVDRSEGLFSMPAKLGVSRALWVSRGLHVVSAGALIGLAWLSPQLGMFFAIACGLVVVLLVVEHALIGAGKTQHMKIAFGTINGVISLVLGAAGIVDVIRHVM